MAGDIGCGDNSCVFKVLRGPGVGTNGGCRCFDNLISYLPEAQRWNRDEVRRVRMDTQRLASELRRAREQRDALREGLAAAVELLDCSMGVPCRPDLDDKVRSAMKAVTP
jgi:hypothetical protein